MTAGWICLHRSIWDWPYSNDPEYLSVWIFILTSATHKGVDKVFKGDRVTLKPGQFITGRIEISKKTGVHESKVQRILKKLEIEQQIEQQKSTKNRLITVANWAQYQSTEQQSEQQMNNKRTTNEQQMNTNNNVNNITNKQSPPIVPQGTEWVEGTLSEFYENSSCDDFKEICTALARKKGMSIERADQEFEKFEKYWLSPAIPKSIAKKKDWRRTFTVWLSKAKFEPVKESNFELAAEIHRNAMQDDEIKRILAVGDKRLESNLPFLRALNAGYSREQISEVIYQICDNPPKSKIFSWNILNAYFN